MGLITLKEAAERLGVSLPTVRRMIKDGRLNGELRDGPYGRTYYIDEANIRTAQELVDVVPVTRPVSVEALADAVAARIQETLIKALEASAEEQARTRVAIEALAEKEARTQEELETLRQELAGTRAELAAAIEALKKLTEKEERRPWWRRLFK